MSRVRSVLFDWRGTIVHDPEPAWWVGRALEAVGRVADADEVERLVHRLELAATLPQFAAAERTLDCSAEYHHVTSLRMFREAGLDDEVAAALYALDFEPSSHPLYPDARSVLRVLKKREIKVALVSDIHFDLRSELRSQGLAQYFDEFILSFEHGVQKPDPRIFELALDALGAEPGETLMVGDRESHDGAAALLGIQTVILAKPENAHARRLGVVLDLTA